MATHPLPSYNESQLVVALQQQDRQAFAQLYDNYASALLGVINKVVNNIEAAEEILQDSFLKIWNNIHQYDASKGRLFTWMLNISRNTAIDYARVKKNNHQHDDLDTSVKNINAQHHEPPVQLDSSVAEMSKSLSGEHQKLIDLVYVQGYTQAEVAEMLEIPLGTVKTRLRAAIVQLRKVYLIALSFVTLLSIFYNNK